MSKINFLLSAFIISSCLAEREEPNEEKGIFSGGKNLAKIADEVFPRIDNLVKSGHKSNVDELGTLIKASGKSGKAAILAFKEVVTSRANKVDDLISQFDELSDIAKTSDSGQRRLQDINSALDELLEKDKTAGMIGDIIADQDQYLRDKLIVNLDDENLTNWLNVLDDYPDSSAKMGKLVKLGTIKNSEYGFFLHGAAVNGDKELVNFLLKNGVSSVSMSKEVASAKLPRVRLTPMASIAFDYTGRDLNGALLLKVFKNDPAKQEIWDLLKNAGGTKHVGFMSMPFTNTEILFFGIALPSSGVASFLSLRGESE